MQNNNLPTEDLKKYGIVDENNSFSTKLSESDIQKFLQGYTIVADNDKNRATFQLVENNSRLNVVFLERDKSITKILEKSKDKIEYSNIQELSISDSEEKFEKKAFVYDKKFNKIVEFDMIKNITELTAIIADKNDVKETNRYRIELLKLKGFLQYKIDKFPEMAKEITNDLNIVSKEIGKVESFSQNEMHSQTLEKSEIELNVNDPDMYQDANRIREEKLEDDQDHERSKGFRR